VPTAGDPGSAEQSVLGQYDGYDRQTSQRYFDIVADARQRCPVAHSAAHGGYWIVSGHDDTRRILSDPETFSNANGIMIPVEDRLRKPPQDLDPPLQTDFRRLLNRYFSRHGLARHTERSRELAAAQVAAVLPLGDRAAGGLGCDIITDFAKPLTAAVLSTVILDLRDPERFAQMAALVAQISRGSVEDNAIAFRNLQDAVDKLLGTLGEREDRDDVLNAVLRGTVADRPLTHDEQVGTIMQLLLGGLKTTVAAIGHIVASIARGDVPEDLLRQPGWSVSYLDEFLRYESPVKMIARTVTREVTLGGDMVAVMLPSANRDDARFTSPDELDLTRRENPHLAFGLGVHRCIGSNLARLEITTAIDALLARAGNIGLVPGTVLSRTPSAAELSWETVPVQFDLRLRTRAAEIGNEDGNEARPTVKRVSTIPTLSGRAALARREKDNR
jgi:cytochrome P450